jgi:hypothetical protein
LHSKSFFGKSKKEKFKCLTKNSVLGISWVLHSIKKGAQMKKVMIFGKAG